jgi:16S rRNA processing protein RimM
LEHPARNDRWVVAVAGVEGIEAADALRGAELRVEASALKVLGAETYYLHDLEGCRVRTVAGEDLGDVRRVDMTVGTPVLVVEREGREVLVPLAEAICRKVDVRAKRIVVDPPEGLLELNVT